MPNFLDYFDLTANAYFNAAVKLAVVIALAIITNLFMTKIVKRLARLTKSDIDDRVIDSIHTPTYLTVFLAGFLVILNGMNQTIQFLEYSHRIVYTIMTFIWTIALIRVTRIIIENTTHRLFDVSGVSSHVIPLVSSISRIILIIAFIIGTLAIWQVDVTPLLASAGIVSAIIAIGAKDAIANFFGGLSVFLDKPYKIGDYIELDQKERGEVVAVGIRSTRINTRDGILITIPNSIIANSKIVNESAPVKNFRVRIPIGIAYGTDIDKLEAVLIEIASNNENVLNDPEPRVRFREFGESSLRFELLCWANEPSIRGLTIDQLSREIYKRFAKEGIELPYPHRVVEIHKVEKTDKNQII